jgi:aspartyl-tRNA(Asn)/glutamyl-tRNA(Gln) amidotransferase subunit B
MTGIDLNRAGTPLLEIVSEPDMRSAKEAVAYAKAIHALIRYLDISDGNMAEGSMRCDCNVSIRKPGQPFGTRREIKNVNSFKFIEKAIQAEVLWQMDELESGRSIVQSTVLYDVAKNETRAMRSKEEANDYRYFPDPDLLPVIIDDTTLNEIRASLPELPAAKRARFESELGLSAYDAGVLVASRDLSAYFEATMMAAGGVFAAKAAANWVTGELLAALNRSELDILDSPVSPEQLGGLILRITDNTISGKIAKQVFAALMAKEGASADEIIATQGLKQETDTGAIEAVIREVIANNAAQVEQYRASDEAKQAKLFGFFVGQVMKASRGKANPAAVNDLLKTMLMS